MTVRMFMLAVLAGVLSYGIGFYAGHISGHYKAHRECMIQFHDALSVNVCNP